MWDNRACQIYRNIGTLPERPRNKSQIRLEKNIEVPWRDMAGIRDRLVHGYFKVNLEIVWMTVTSEFPEVRPMMENVLADIDL